MKGGGIIDGIYSLLFIIAVVGAMVLGGWLALKYVKTKDQKAPAPKPEPKPEPEPQYPGWGPGPWGPDPWTPDYKPEVPGVKPPDNFTPVLTLMNAKYDPVNRYINVNYKILPSGSVPPSKSFSISYSILVDGKPVGDIPEDEPISPAEMTGLQQSSLVPVTGVASDVKASSMKVTAQIHFRETGTAYIGVVGVPVSINVT